MEDIDRMNIEAKQRLVSGLRGKGAHLSFDGAVGDFPSSLYNTKPENVPYTFWHQIEHIRIAQYDIFKYVVNPGHVSPSWPKGYWPDPTAKADEQTWNRSIKQYEMDIEELVEMIHSDDINVLAPVSHNNGRSILGSMLIVIDHTGYHLGEFVMGRQILGAWQSELS